MKSNTVGLAIVAALVAFATCLAYFNSLDGPFVFDDIRNVRENQQIRIDSLSPSSLIGAMQGNPTPRPIAYLSFALNFYFGGLDVSGYHWINTLIHALNGVLVFLLAKTILCRISYDGLDPKIEKAYFASLAIALIFVLHPVQTQAVTFIVQRMTSLCTLFYLAALLAWVAGRDASLKSYKCAAYCTAFVLWLLALGTKQFAVTLPAVILMFEWILYQNGKWKISYLYGLIATAVSVAFICYVFKGDQFLKIFTRGYSQREFTLTERLLTEGRVILHYVSLIVWPSPSRLTLVYEFPLSRSLFNPLSTLISWMAIGTAIVWAFLNAKKYPLSCLSIFWFFLHLVVESTVIPLEIVYEHRLYLPLFGLALLFTVSVFQLIDHRICSLAVVLVLCVGLGYWTQVRNQAWQSGLALWTDNVQKTPNGARPLLGLALEEAQLANFPRALVLLNRAIESEPNFQALYVRRGQMNEALNRRKLAMSDYNHAISIPHKIRRGSIYDEAFTARGNLYRLTGQFQKALQDLERALTFNDSNANTYLARADLFAVTNAPSKAIADYEQAISLRPNSVNAHKNLAWLLATESNEQIADPKAAIELATQCCELSEWADHSALSTLAAAYARALQFEEAIQYQQKAFDLAPAHLKEPLQARINLFQQNTPIVIERNSKRNSG